MKANSKHSDICKGLKKGEKFIIEKEIDKYRGVYFVGVTGEYNPLYIDQELAKALDLPSTPIPPYFLSSLIGGFLIQMADSTTCLRSICIKMKKDIFGGNVLRLTGKIVQKKRNYAKIVFEVKNEKGEQICSECWAELGLSN